MSKPPARNRLAQAAFALFDERGYEQSLDALLPSLRRLTADAGVTEEDGP
jgi:hypothetical protein